MATVLMAYEYICETGTERREVRGLDNHGELSTHLVALFKCPDP